MPPPSRLVPQALLRHVVAGAGVAILSCVHIASAQSSAPESAPAEDVLVFKNGDRLSGKLQRSVGGNIVFKSDMAGEITVPLDKVQELRTEGAFAVLKHKDPVAVSRKAEPGKIVLTDGNVSVTNAEGTGSIVAIKDVAYMVDAKTFQRDLVGEPKLWEGWNGAVNFGTTFVQSTTHGGTLVAGVALVRQVPVVTYFRARNKTIVNFQENYGVLSTPAIPQAGLGAVSVKTSIMHADLERDEYVRKNLYLLGTSSFDHNYAQSLALQQIYGFGIGWTPIDTPVQTLDLKADAHYERQKFFFDIGNQNLIGSSFSEAYRRSLPMKVTLAQNLTIIPGWNNLNASSGNGSVILTAPLFRRLSMNVTAADSFLNNPVPGYRKNSFTFSTGLTYTLR